MLNLERAQDWLQSLDADKGLTKPRCRQSEFFLGVAILMRLKTSPCQGVNHAHELLLRIDPELAAQELRLKLSYDLIEFSSTQFTLRFLLELNLACRLMELPTFGRIVLHLRR